MKTILVVVLVLAISERFVCGVEWSDEFNYNGQPNPNEWIHEIGNNHGNNHEAQWYTDSTANSNVANGFLTITALKQNQNGFKYTSARLVTKRTFTYGVFEMRAKLPKGRGTWPAFWLVGQGKWPDNGELDIMEHVGYNPNVIQSTIHCKRSFGGNGKHGVVKASDVFDTFHTYKMDWNSKRVIFYFDNQVVFQYNNDNAHNKDTWPFDGPMKLILNSAIGGDWGGQKGIDDSIFPAHYVIDYVRVHPPTP